MRDGSLREPVTGAAAPCRRSWLACLDLTNTARINPGIELADLPLTRLTGPGIERHTASLGISERGAP